MNMITMRRTSSQVNEEDEASANSPAKQKKKKKKKKPSLEPRRRRRKKEILAVAPHSPLMSDAEAAVVDAPVAEPVGKRTRFEYDNNEENEFSG